MRKKLWYVPGLYSLLGLPILLLLFGPEDVQEKVALHFFLADDSQHNDETIRPTTKRLIAYASTKKLTTIVLDADYLAASGKYSANSKLEFIRREMQRLAFTRDTSVALRIDLRRNSTYGEFVWLINQAKVNDIRRYALAGNSFYFFHNDIFEYNDSQPLSLEAEGYPPPHYEGPSWWETLQWE